MKKLKGNMKLLIGITMILISGKTYAQISPTDSIPPDPASIAVYTVQSLHFGSFTQGAVGGSVILSPTGSRTSTGDVVLLNMGSSSHESIFEVEAIAGTVISIMNGPNATLTGSNGGTMSMVIGTSSPSMPLSLTVQPPTRTQVRIGGTLIVGAPASNPPGTYSGTFYVTFNQE